MTPERLEGLKKKIKKTNLCVFPGDKDSAAIIINKQESIHILEGVLDEGIRT